MKLDFNFFVFNRRLNMGNIKPLLIKMNIIGYGRVYFRGIKGPQSEKSISEIRLRLFLERRRQESSSACLWILCLFSSLKRIRILFYVKKMWRVLQTLVRFNYDTFDFSPKYYIETGSTPHSPSHPMDAWTPFPAVGTWAWQPIHI
jgi:hypothetical protein